MASGPFPTDVQEFDADDRISFSKLDNKFIAVHEDGEEYEFDADNKRWILPDDQDFEAEVPPTSEYDAHASSALGKRKHDGDDNGQNGNVSDTHWRDFE